MIGLSNKCKDSFDDGLRRMLACLDGFFSILRFNIYVLAAYFYDPNDSYSLFTIVHNVAKKLEHFYSFP